MPELSSSVRARASFADERDIDEFVETLGKFERGEISSEAWRKFRLVRGTYGQRQDDVQMLRVKIPQGVLTAEQVEALADVADRYSRGFAHVTNGRISNSTSCSCTTWRRRCAWWLMQVSRRARPAATPSAISRRAPTQACPWTKCSTSRPTRRRSPDTCCVTHWQRYYQESSRLPSRVAPRTTPSRRSTISAGLPGSKSTMASRLGAFACSSAAAHRFCPPSARALFDFLPAGEMLNVAEAILRVYHRLGDHEHRQRNRMKFLIKALGWERWRDEVLLMLDEVRRDGPAALSFDPEHPPEESAPQWTSHAAPSAGWIRSMVTASETRGPGITPSSDATEASAEALDACITEPIHEERINPRLGRLCDLVSSRFAQVACKGS